MKRSLISSLSHYIIKRNYSPHFRDPTNFNRILNVTDAACDQLRLLKGKFPEKKFRLAVEAGGCHGFQYKFSLDTSENLDLESTDDT